MAAKKQSKALANLKQAPPAPKGNQRALAHGAHASPQNLRGLAAARLAVYEGLAASAPVRAADGSLPVADEAIVELAAGELARYRQVGEWIDEHGLFDSEGLRPVVAQHSKIARNLAELLDRLGMAPRARAALGVDLQRGFDLAKHWADEGDDDAA